MSYYTIYQIEVIKGKASVEDVQNHLYDIGWHFSREYYEDAEGRYIAYLFGEYKRFNAFSVMVDLSKVYPDTVFKVLRQGEDSDDIGIAYYCNGMFQNANRKVSITEDEFDYNKLVRGD